MLDLKLLEKLCMCGGISGDEDEVRELIINEIKPYADDIQVDSLGNLFVKKKGKNRAISKLMLSAHMDEVGLIVTDITMDGYLKFDEVGGIDRRILPGKRVLVGKNKLHGIIGIKPIHLCRGDDKSTIPEMTDMYIDIGANSRQDALSVTDYGESITFVSDFSHNHDTITAKALDDRFGCLVLIELIKSELEYDMEFVFAVQEEVGLRGAKTAAYTVDPEFALVIETTTAADIPEVDEHRQVCNLSGGAVISFMDRRTIYDKDMIDLAFACGEEQGVNVQYKRAVAGGNDAGVIHSSRGGVRTLAISLPCRYLHSPSSVVNRQDCEDMLMLVKTVSQKIAGGILSEKGNCGK